MTRFELEEPTTVTVANVNLRAEKHGEDTVPAVDLKLSLQAGNDVLARFAPQLKISLYTKAAAPIDKQTALEGMAVSDLPNLRFPLLGPLKWDAELLGYSCVVDYGLGGKSALQLDDCKLGAFVITALEGGTVEVTWRVQAAKLSEKVMGKLGTLIGHDVDVTLTGPGPADDQAPNTAGNGEIKSATDLFVSAAEAAWPFPKDADKSSTPPRGHLTSEPDPGPAPVAAAKKKQLRPGGNRKVPAKKAS